jgi:thioredoxin reductase (NADPH)
MTTLLWALALVAFVSIPYLLWRRADLRRDQRGVQLHEDIAAIGHELVPVSLHPELLTDSCIGSGSCITACPEDQVLAMVHGQMKLVNPLSCVGHGECLKACPVQAIKLVFGTATRGVELPRLSATFESTQAGIYIVGELGGMGLIRNAIAQGRQAAQAILKSGRRAATGQLDAIVVGAGPAGIAASLALMNHGLKIQILEQGEYGGTIKHYPRAKLVMSGTLDLPGYGSIRRKTMSKEDLVQLWDDIRAKMQFPVREGTRVERIVANAPAWSERTKAWERGQTWTVHAPQWQGAAANVVLALGRRGAPRTLGIPGEELDKVCYRVIEPEPFAGKHVLIVGGGNAAADCALALADAGICKSLGLSYRKPELLRMRASVRARLQQCIDTGLVTAHLSSEVVSIEEKSVVLKTNNGLQRLNNDSVVIQIGGTSPNDLLKSAGIELVEKFAEA